MLALCAWDRISGSGADSTLVPWVVLRMSEQQHGSGHRRMAFDDSCESSIFSDLDRKGDVIQYWAPQCRNRGA